MLESDYPDDPAIRAEYDLAHARMRLDMEERVRQQADAFAVRRERTSRVRCYLMPQDRLLLALQGMYVIEGLPADAEFLSCCYRWERRSFGIVICSKEFDTVPDGAETSIFPAPEVVGQCSAVDLGAADSPRFVYLAENQKIERTADGKVRFREFL